MCDPLDTTIPIMVSFAFGLEPGQANDRHHCTTSIHRRTRRRSGIADRGARAAACAVAAYRCAHGWCCGRSGIACCCRRVSPRDGRTRLDRPPQHGDRLSLGSRRSGALWKVRERAGRTVTGCHRGRRRPVGGCIATGDPFDTDRVRGCQRSRRKWLGCKPGAAGRQSHWLCLIRVRLRREVARVAQANRARCETRSAFFGIRPTRPALASLPQSRR